MCKRNSPHKNEASKVCVRETPPIKKEKKKDVRTGRVRETPHIKKKEPIIGCVKKFLIIIEKCQTSYL